MHTKHTIAALVASVLTLASHVADARQSRVAVAPFAGPGDVARAAHEAVVEITASRYDVVPSIEILEASAEAGADARSPLSAMRVARITGADTVVIGRVAASGDGFKLTLSVRLAASGRSVGAVLVPMFSESVDPAAYNQIKPLLLQLLSSVAHIAKPARRGDAVASRATAQDVRQDDGDEDEDEDEDDEEFEPIDLPFNVFAAAGLSATTRRLSFTQEADLDNQGLAGSPVPAVRFETEVRTEGTNHLGVAFSFDRSFGGKIALQEIGESTEIGLTQSQWSIGLRGRVRLRRFEVKASLGYNELSYRLTLPPQNVRIPSAAYSFMDVGGGLAARFADDAVKVHATARYLHVLTVGGITDPEAFGRAQSRGFDGELGLEIRVTDSIFVRVGATYLRLVHAFDGSGAMTTNLDDDPELDVAGAADAFTGGYAQLAFLL